MARFYVGQRVKKVRGKSGVGVTGQVLMIGGDNRDARWSMFVRTDKPIQRVYVESGIFADIGSEGWTDQDLWEAILPEGHQPAELTIDELLPFLKNREVA